MQDGKGMPRVFLLLRIKKVATKVELQRGLLMSTPLS